MDFERAIDYHVQWKTRLNKYVIGLSTENLQAADVSRVDACLLGQWIKQKAKCLSHLPSFPQLVIDHSKFHACAGDIVTNVDLAHIKKAKALLSGTFLKLSKEVVQAIRKVEKESTLEDK